MSSVGSHRWKRGRILGILLLSLITAGMSGPAPVAANPEEATTEAFAAAAQAESEAGDGSVEPQAFPGAVAAVVGAARVATVGARQLARTPAFRQQVAQATRQAGVFRQLAGAFGFGAAASASSPGMPDDVERIFDD